MEDDPEALVNRILDLVQVRRDWTLEEVLAQLHETDWVDVMYAIHSLSRKGRVHLVQDHTGLTTAFRG